MTVESRSSAATVTETQGATIPFERSNDVIREGAPPSDAADDALAREDNHTGTEMDHTVAHTVLEAPASSACLELLATNAKPVDDNHQPQHSQTPEHLAPDKPEGISLLGPEATEQPYCAKTSGPGAGQESEGEGAARSLASAASPSDSGTAGFEALPSATTGTSDEKQQEEQKLSDVDSVDSCRDEEVAASDRDDGAGPPSEGPCYRESAAGDSETLSPAVESEEDDSVAQKDVSAAQKRCDSVREVSAGADSMGTKQSPASGNDESARSTHITSLDGVEEMHPLQPPTRHDLQTSCGCASPTVEAVTVGKDSVQYCGGGDENLRGFLLVSGDAQHFVEDVTSSSLAAFSRDKLRRPELAVEMILPGAANASRETPPMGRGVNSEEVTRPLPDDSQHNEPAPSPDSSLCKPPLVEITEGLISRVFEVVAAKMAAAAAEASTHVAVPEVATTAERLELKILPEVDFPCDSPSASEGMPADGAIQPPDEARPDFGQLSLGSESPAKQADVMDDDRKSTGVHAAEVSGGTGDDQEEATAPATPATANNTPPQPHSSCSLPGTVVEEYGLHEIPRLLAAEVVTAAIAAVMPISSSACEPASVTTAPPPSDSGAEAGTETTVKADSLTAGQDPASDLAASSTIVEQDSAEACPAVGDDLVGRVENGLAVGQESASDLALAARSIIVEQESVEERESCPDDGDDLVRSVEENPCGDGPRSPTPPSTREGEGTSTIDPEPEREAPSRAESTAGGDRQPRHDSRSAEALLYLTEAGSRAKSRQQRSEEIRVDASSWLRDAGGRALAAQGEGDAEGLEHAVVAEYVTTTLQRVVAEEAVAVAGVAPVSPSACAPETKTGDQATPRVPPTLEPGTPEGDRFSNTGPGLHSEAPCFVRSAADGDKSPAPGDIDASTCLAEDGSRAKSLRENVGDNRVDTSPRLRDTEERTNSPQSVDQAALLERAVVTDYLSGALTRAVEAEAATADAALDASSSEPSNGGMMGKDQATPGAPYPRGDTEDAINVAEIGAKADDEISSGEDPVPELAMHSPVCEATATGEQESPDHGDTSPKDGDDQSDKANKNGSDGLQLPTPLCTPEEEGPSTDKSEIKPEVPSNAVLTADGSGSPAPRSTEALVYLTEAGERAKSLQEGSEKARLDASLWLRDTAGKALSRESVATADPSLDTPPGTVTAELAAAAAAASPPSTACTPPAETTVDAQSVQAASTLSPTCDPGSPEKQERISDADQEPGQEKPSGVVSATVGDGQSPSRGSTEGLTCLEEGGEREKESSEGRGVDGSSFVRDTEGRTPSVEDKKQAARAECVVVEEDLSETMAKDVGVEVAATATTTAAPSTPGASAPASAGRDKATLGASAPRDPGAADVAENAVEADDVTTTVRQDFESALRFSIVEAMAVVGQGSAGQRESSEKGGRCVIDTSRERPGSPTPPGTPEEDTPRTSSLGLDPEVTFNPDTDPADRGQPPPPQPAEASSACPAEVGLREEALREASGWLLLAGGRAKSAQDRAESAREEASSWLRDAGGRALSLQGRDDADRLECAAWLRLTGGRAKSAQDRAERAREEASSWLRDTGGRAVSLQDRAEGVRSGAAAWLAARGASELEQTAPTTRRAEDATAEASAAEVKGEEDGQGTGESKSLQGPPTQDGSRPGSPFASSPSQPEKPSAATAETEDVVARAADQETTREAPSHNAEEAVTAKECFPTVGKDDRAENINNTSTPSPAHDQTLNPAESAAAAAAAAPVAITTANTAAVYPTAQLTIGRTASSDRTAPVPWQEPATTPLDRGGSFAPTAAGPEDLGRMLDAGEKEWSRVSLSRTPPFDALNSPSLPQRYAPIRGRPRPLPPEAKAEAVAGAGAGVGPNADGPGWFFAPPDQMAPKGDAYRGSDSFHSADASASTTVRGDSSGSFVSPSQGGSGGTDDGRRPRRRDNGGSGGDHASTRCFDGGGGGGGVWEETTLVDGLGDAINPAREAQCRMMNRAAVAGEEGKAHLGRRWEETGTPSLGSRNTRGSGNRWHKKVEQSRQYLRRWEVFLSRAHRHFDGEADVRKRMSVIRRAHPDVSNEVAFVALAQSRGRSSEAAAVLHLPRAKDEAALVAMMLDVTAFIGLAREAAERRRRSRQLEHQRRRMETVAGGAAKRPAHHHQGKGEHRQPSWRQHQRQQEEWYSHPEDHRRDSAEDKQRLNNYIWEQQQQRQKQGEERRSGHEWARDDASTGVIGDAAENNWHSQRNKQDYGAEPISAGGNAGRSRGEAQSRRSDSAPSLLPPIEGWLTEGTPPSPNSLKTVLSTSTSVAVGVPSGFGLASVAGVASKGEGGKIVRVRSSKSTSRELRAMLRARARWQSQRMAEMATPGSTEQRQQQGWGGSGLDALAERFLRETDTLDRDSKDLDTRLRGRQKNKRGPSKLRGPHNDGGGGRGERRVFGNGGGDAAWRGGDSGDGVGGRGGGRGRGGSGRRRPSLSSSSSSSSMFLASVNRDPNAPFMSLETPAAVVVVDGGSGVCSTSSFAAAAVSDPATAAAASAASCAVEADGGEDRESCREQGYFTQAGGWR
ncbi:hypothetical protein Esi_0165_0065 [Ectocarpus siliculosus]|uniref:Uncharacterized protein n=1 Tax=Ectocarpus siliculosus TaxID=2880 RepID=D8LGD3_ECTSI|nr:hypothetical protein Esi_0165_0065 [Ectocarpus siliculosus]|eukprot:CBN79032.1 hypothetical protein Esi_0165_0065 [Ectocarpus siliculosus]